MPRVSRTYGSAEESENIKIYDYRIRPNYRTVRLGFQNY